MSERKQHFVMEDTREIESAEKKRELDKAFSMKALEYVMGSALGRHFVWEVLEDAGIYRTSFTGNSTTFFNEGMRNMGLKVLARVRENCPEQAVLMESEHMKKGK